TLQLFGVPVIAPRLALVAVHALLHDRPFAVVGDEEAVEIEVEAVLYAGAVDLGDKAAGADQTGGIKALTFAEPAEFVRGLARVLPAAAADMQAEFALQWLQAPLQR